MTSDSKTNPIQNIVPLTTEEPPAYNPDEKPGSLQYLYYRVYADDGGIPTRNPVDQTDWYLGCIRATSVAPPHTVSSLKLRLANAEHLRDHRQDYMLFLTLASPSPMDDAGRISIRGKNSPGLLPQEPLVLVTKLSDAERSALTELDNAPLQGDNVTSSEPRYVYYRIYTPEGDMPSKHPIDADDPSLARLDPRLVAPPHTSESIKRLISRVEEKPGLASGQLFADMWCESPMDGSHIPILSEDCPGLTPESPMAIVQINDTPVQTAGNKYTREIKLISGAWVSDDPKWLTRSVGDIFHTDGVLMQAEYRGHTISEMYEARNGAGQIGFVPKRIVEFC